jgi:hypothetical protein
MRRIFISAFCLMLAGCGLDETLYRADKPVSREAASKKIPIPFPPSAKDIYYVFYAGGLQDLEEYVRFTVDPKDLDRAVSDILSDHDKVFHETNSYPSLPVTDSPLSGVSKHLSPISWWNPASITNGYCRGSMNGRPIYVWVDVGQHIIYVCETD